MSSRSIADAVGVSHHTVDAIRSELGNCPPDKRKAIQRLVEAAGEMSSRAIADAVGCCNHMVEAVRSELGIIPPEKRKGRDGKHYPAKMKREKRGEKDELGIIQVGEFPNLMNCLIMQLPPPHLPIMGTCPYDARRVNFH